jgi:hypothetical protein
MLCWFHFRVPSAVVVPILLVDLLLGTTVTSGQCQETV